MSELERYVNGLFKKYRYSKKADDLKAEILSNLEAKKADLMAGGLDEQAAIQKTKSHITSVDNLIDNNKEIYINNYQLDYLQQALVYLAVAWIVTIPLMIVGNFMNLFYLCAIVTMGIIYFYKKSHKSKKRKYVNIHSYNKLKRVIWLLWVIYFIISIIAITGIYFGSNIWFNRSIKIGGPYNLAIILSRYFTPFVTIVVPLITNTLPKYILKNEVGDDIE